MIDEIIIKLRVLNFMVRVKVLRRCMWNIGNVFMVIIKWVLEELEEKFEVKLILLWVYLKGVLMYMFFWEGFSFIVSVVGFLVRLYLEIVFCLNFKMVKIFVNVDFIKELLEKINFIKNGEFFMVEFIYFWLSKRCNKCSRWGYEEKVCLINKNGENVEIV